MIHERDEWLLNRLLDGELSAAEERSLHARLDAEPALRAALATLQRVDRALADRRLDRPVVDWAGFHAGVMRAVTPQVAPAARTIRFPVWLRMAMPVAAAAAIVLVVLLQDARLWGPAAPIRGIARQAEDPATPVQVAYAVPAPQSGGRLDVRIHRRPVAADGLTRIAYSRSTELDEHIRQIDEASEYQPSWQVYMADTNVQTPVVLDFFDVPPL